jgi:hypothetical protein
MKILQTIIPVCCLLAAASGISAKDFEGKVCYIKSEGGKQTNSSYFLKGGFIRVEAVNEKGVPSVTIMDMAKLEAITLMPDNKMYMAMKIPVSKAEELAAQTELVRTGEKQTILGHSCEKILIKGKDYTVETWGAEGMGTFTSIAPRGSGAKNGWEALMAAQGFFPLRTIHFNKKGKETMRMEVTSVEPQSLSSSLFEVPADYKKFEMPGLGSFNPFGRKDN